MSSRILLLVENSTNDANDYSALSSVASMHVQGQWNPAVDAEMTGGYLPAKCLPGTSLYTTKIQPMVYRDGGRRGRCDS